jgi:Zn-dependent protease with chaperone function
MNRMASSVTGKVYDGKVPVAYEANLVIYDKNVTVFSEGNEYTYPIDSLKCSPVTGSAERFILLPNGYQLQVTDKEIQQEFPPDFILGNIVDWLEKRVELSIIGILTFCLALFFAYFYGTPYFVEKLIERIPYETEPVLGEQVFNWLEKGSFLEKSRLSAQVKKAIEKNVLLLQENYPELPDIKVYFGQGEQLGVAPLSLPGGIIVVPDGLVELTDSNDEIIAVLAHEAGHVYHRHALKKILQNSLAAIVIVSITSDASALDTIKSDLPALFLQSGYSDEYEREADLFTVQVLRSNMIPTTVLKNILQRIEQERGEGERGQLVSPSFHPKSMKRGRTN